MSSMGAYRDPPTCFAISHLYGIFIVELSTTNHPVLMTCMNKATTPITSRDTSRIKRVEDAFG